jgi:hypothetical protein
MILGRLDYGKCSCEDICGKINQLCGKFEEEHRMWMESRLVTLKLEKKIFNLQSQIDDLKIGCGVDGVLNVEVKKLKEELQDAKNDIFTGQRNQDEEYTALSQRIDKLEKLSSEKIFIANGRVLGEGYTVNRNNFQAEIYKDSELPMGTNPIYKQQSEQPTMPKKCQACELLLACKQPDGICSQRDRSETLTKPSLTVNDLEKGCWYSLITNRGALVIIKFSEISSGGSVVCKKALEISLLEGCVMIHDNLYILPGFINLGSIKKLA